MHGTVTPSIAIGVLIRRPADVECTHESPGNLTSNLARTMLCCFNDGQFSDTEDQTLLGTMRDSVLLRSHDDSPLKMIETMAETPEGQRDAALHLLEVIVPSISLR